jgi:nucleoside phosphorylase
MDQSSKFPVRQSKRAHHDDNDETSTSSFKRSKEVAEYPSQGHGSRQKKLVREQYTIGWISALPIEMAAAQCMLDEAHEVLDRLENDNNTYHLGSIGKHNIAIACLPNNGYGTHNAATVAGNMRRSFPSIQAFLMVGIAGGVPDSTDLRLGDIVIGNEVVPYDFGKVEAGGSFRSTVSLNKPPTSLMTAVAALRARHESKPSGINAHILEMLNKHPSMTKYSRPYEMPDHLFKSNYDGHNHTQGAIVCTDCDKNEMVVRPERADTSPRIYYGRIASGNKVMKHGATRERLAQEHGVLCFEMEAAGLMDGFDCLPIRGICDYSDAHKNKHYQEYAAAVAAAYAKELLAVLAPYAVDPDPIQKPSPASEDEVDVDRRRRLLDSLSYRQINSRHDTIKAAHRKTCKWILEKPEFSDWRDASKRAEHHGFLWITGKPGAGKSTIMKFAFESEKKKKRRDHAVLSFFFNRRGDNIEWSVAGMYRSLIFQVLRHFSDIQCVLDDPRYDDAEWDAEILRDLFSAAIDRLGPRSLTCFIDALDECDQQDIWEMVEHFEALGEQSAENNIGLNICFASRHYPHIDISHRIKMILVFHRCT